MKTTHLTRLTCACGNEAEVPSKPSFGETELGSLYAEIRWSPPEGWSYTACPKCRKPPEPQQ